MVIHLSHHFCLLAQQAATPEKMPPPTRAAVYMALIGILLLGMLLVIIILLGGHWVRRWGAYRRGPSVPADFILSNDQPTKQPNTDTHKIQKPSPDDRSQTDTAYPDDTQNS